MIEFERVSIGVTDICSRYSNKLNSDELLYFCNEFVLACGWNLEEFYKKLDITVDQNWDTFRYD